MFALREVQKLLGNGYVRSIVWICWRLPLLWNLLIDSDMDVRGMICERNDMDMLEDWRLPLGRIRLGTCWWSRI